MNVVQNICTPTPKLKTPKVLLEKTQLKKIEIPEIVKRNKSLITQKNLFKNKKNIEKSDTQLRPSTQTRSLRKKQLQVKSQSATLDVKKQEPTTQVIKDFSKDSHIIGWRDGLSSLERQKLSDYMQKIAYDDIGRPVEIGTFVKVGSLLDDFSDLNYIKQKDSFYSKVDKKIDDFIGSEKQFSDRQSFLDALDKERLLLENFISKTSNQDALKSALETRNAYDRLISYIAKKDHLTVQTQKKISEKNIKYSGIGKQVIFSGNKINTSVERNVYSMVKAIESDIYSAYSALQVSLKEIQKYEVMRNNYINKLNEVESLYNQLKDLKAISISKNQINDYNFKVEELSFFYKNIQRNQSKIQAAYDKAAADCNYFQQLFNKKIKTIEDVYSSYHDILKKELEPLIKLYEEALLKKNNLEFQKYFLKNLTEESVLMHKELAFNLMKNRTFDGGVDIKEKWIEKFFEVFKNSRVKLADSDTSDCRMFNATYVNLQNSFSIFVDKVKYFDNELQKFKEDTDINLYEKFKIDLINFLNQLNQFHIKAKANNFSNDPSFKDCFLTVNRMNDLLQKVEKFLAISNNLFKKFTILEVKAQEYQKKA